MTHSEGWISQPASSQGSEPAEPSHHWWATQQPHFSKPPYHHQTHFIRLFPPLSLSPTKTKKDVGTTPVPGPLW